ncbi:hypothetical protein EQV96_18240 [Pseudomonas sp. TMW22080]|nr:hypothetical protein [Pseudomonas sp. TMW22080]
MLAMQTLRFCLIHRRDAIASKPAPTGCIPTEKFRHKKAAFSGGFFVDQHTDRILTPSGRLP